MRSDKTLTRYEIASVVKNILESVPAKDQTEDMARLKKEYTRELEAQGYREKKKKEERKPILEISGDTRVRYKNDGGSDARARVNTTWHIGKTDIVAGGSAEKDMSKTPMLERASGFLIACYECASAHSVKVI